MKRANLKFNKPNLNYEIYETNILKKYLKRIKNFPLTIIDSGLGTGKTSALVKFIHQNSKDNISWYQIEDSILNSKQFWNNIYEGFKYHNLIAKEVKLDFNRKDLLQELDLLVSEYLLPLQEDLYIIIDNFEFINDNQSILETVSYFVEITPANIHLVISGRGEINFPKLPLWQVENKVLIIPDEVFKLNKKQIKEFSLKNYELFLSDSDCELILEKTKGWILAIDLIITEVEQGVELEAILNDLRGKCKLLFEYLEYHLLDFIAVEDSELKEFLLKSSLLSTLEVKICNKFFQKDSSHQMIEKLIDWGVLIEKKADNKYQYNPIIKEVLQCKAEREYDREKLLIKAKNIYNKENKITELINYNLKINNKEEIIRLFKQNFNRWLEEDKLESLKQVFEVLTKEDLIANPILFLYQGDLYYQEEEFKKSVTNYKQAKRSFKKNGNKKGLLTSLFRLAEFCAFFSSSKILDYLNELKQYKSHFSLQQQNRLKELEVVSLIVKGRLKEAELALERVEDKDAYKELKANILFGQGKFGQIEMLLEEIRFSSFADYLIYHTFIIPALFYLYTGQKYSAQRYIWHEVTIKNGYLKELGQYYLTTSYNLLGDYKVDYCREQYLNSLTKVSQNSIGISWYKIAIFRELIFWEIYYGGSEQALEYANQGLMTAIKKKDILGQGLMLALKGVCYYSRDELKKAEESLSQALDKLIKSGAELHIFLTLMLRGKVFYTQDKIEEFKVDIKEAIKIFKQNKYHKFALDKISLLVKNPNLLVNIFDYAKSEGIETSYIKNLFQKKKLEKSEHIPNYMLRIRSFGKLEVFRGQQKVKNKEWTRKKAKELLKLFLVYRGELLSKERICSFLWPDKKIEKAFQSFYVVLNCLNKILEPQRESRANPYFISKRDNYYGLEKIFSYYYDVELFEEFIKEGNRSNQKRIKMKFYQQAVEIYQADFLVDDLTTDWIVEEKERLEKKYLDIAEELMKYHYEEEDYQDSIEIADKILNKNQYIEAAYLYKIMSYNQLGKRALAIETYQNCRLTLVEELDIKPNQKLQSYYEYLKISE